MVKNNDVEKSAKNAHDDLPLLLQRKCHKLCMAIEAAINKKAVQLIKEKSPYLKNIKEIIYCNAKQKSIKHLQKLSRQLPSDMKKCDKICIYIKKVYIKTNKKTKVCFYGQIG